MAYDMTPYLMRDGLDARVTVSRCVLSYCLADGDNDGHWRQVVGAVFGALLGRDTAGCGTALVRLYADGTSFQVFVFVRSNANEPEVYVATALEVLHDFGEAGEHAAHERTDPSFPGCDMG